MFHENVSASNGGQIAEEESSLSSVLFFFGHRS